MNISETHIVNLRAFGYTEPEARFLYIAATHSGYFTIRQFLAFTKAKSGKRNARFVEKLFALGHASAQRYTRRSLVYHLHCRPLYVALGKDYLRHRREHELNHTKTQLLALDFILTHPENSYFETAQKKRQYFSETLKLDSALFIEKNQSRSPITFSDGFPLFLSQSSPVLPPVVTFTYVDSGHWNLKPYITYLRRYSLLFRQLPTFRFLYISASSRLHDEARELFSLLIEGKGLSELLRYFDLQSKWDRRQYRLLSDVDLIFWYDAKRRFTGPNFETLYRLWKRTRLPDDLREHGTVLPAVPQNILFQAIKVPGHETVFGNSKKRWGDGWQIPGTSQQTSLRTSCKSPAKQFTEQKLSEGAR